jgi:hypothetical protein
LDRLIDLIQLPAFQGRQLCMQLALRAIQGRITDVSAAAVGGLGEV